MMSEMLSGTMMTDRLAVSAFFRTETMNAVSSQTHFQHITCYWRTGHQREEQLHEGESREEVGLQHPFQKPRDDRDAC